LNLFLSGVYCNLDDSWEVEELENGVTKANKFAVPSLEI
jgi:hypothetical protein